MHHSVLRALTPTARRLASTASTSVVFPVERVPVLEEIFEAPVLRTGDMRAETLAEVRGFVPPVLRSQIEASLTSEFGQPILETPWEKYRDPATSWEQAARLVHFTMAVYSNVVKDRKVLEMAAANTEWVEAECQRLYDEIRTGDYSRWESADSLLGEQWAAKLSPAQLLAVKPSLQIISRNASLHPKIKQEVMHEICKIVHSTVPAE